MSENTRQSALNMQQLQGVFSLYSMGRFEEALAAAGDLDRAHPGEPALLNLRGLIHMALVDYAPAIEDFRKAIALRPDVADCYYHLGCAQLEKGDLDDALASFERALELRPDYVDAHSKYCQALELGNRLEALEAGLLRARRQCSVDDPALSLREAELLKRKGDFAAARSRLERSGWRAARDDIRKAAAYLLADLCDRLDDADAAFAFAGEANRMSRAGYAAQRVDATAYRRLIDELIHLVRESDAGEWTRMEIADDRDDPVFLVGFPRSGTTLLDTILLSHEDVAVIEEEPTVFRLESEFIAMKGGYTGGLAALDSADVEKLRQVYFSELDRHVPAAGRPATVVDKLPFNLVQAGLISRVFPDTRFLFAERHPCDVVLSCFMRDFELNEGTAQFLDLRDAAQLYDRIMTLWTEYRQTLPLAVHTVRYEALIEDFEATISACLDFLGLDWDEGVRNYAETAKRRGRISTPSYNQVTQDLYSGASGRWRRYREHLEPVLPVLLPWAEKFGYQQ